MKILICDDNTSETEKISGLLNNLGYESVSFTSGEDALEFTRSGAVTDVCILDIVMPVMSGIELAKKLRESGFGGEIVFLSTSNEYGPQTYDVKAYHYLIKPPSQNEIRQVLDEIKRNHEKSDTSGIKLKVSGTIRFVLFRDIEYVEVIKNNVSVCLVSCESVVVRATMTDIAPQLLCDSRFIQCHQSYIVNMDSIASIATREITTNCGAKIPVSKSYPDTKMRYLRRGLQGN